MNSSNKTETDGLDEEFSLPWTFEWLITMKNLDDHFWRKIVHVGIFYNLVAYYQINFNTLWIYFWIILIYYMVVVQP